MEMDTFDFSLFDSLPDLPNLDTPDIPDNCSHSTLSRNEQNSMTCIDCGLEISKAHEIETCKNTFDQSRLSVRKNTDRSIHQDTRHLPINDNIRDVANEIYLHICEDRIHRGLFRKAIIFASVFYAYKLLKNPQSCDQLLKVFDISRKSALKGLKYVNANLSPDSPLRTMYITAEDLINEFMMRFDATKEQIEDVVGLYNRLKGRSDMLNRSRPQSVAAGIIYYYSIRYGRSLNIKEFTKKVQLSEMTITKIERECDRLENNK